MLINRLSTLVVTLLAAILLASCGGGSITEPQTGTVGIVITDAPSDDFSKINLTITGVELLGEDTRAVLFDEATDGGSRTVDLLSLTDYADLFVMSDAQAGSYSKIRLYIDEIELVPHDERMPAIYPKIPANGKIDLNPRQTFTVVGSEILYIHIDIDADKSIHAHSTGNGEYRFRPVVFVDVISDAFAGKLVRVYGYARDVNVDAASFRLCRLDTPFIAEIDTGSATGDSEHEYCIGVDANAASVFGEDGLPVVLGDVIEEESLLTAIGFIDVLPAEEVETEEVVTAVSHEEGDDRYARVLLRAEVIEMGAFGTFETVAGTIAQAPDVNSLLTMTLADASQLGVQLQNGTKIFSKSGEALLVDALVPGTVVRVDGVVDPGTGHLLASLVIVDETPAAAIEQLSGTVVSVDEDNAQLIITTDGGEKVVLIGDSTLVFGIDADSVEGAFSDRISYTDLFAGQRVDVYGVSNAAGLEATVILALQAEAVPL